MLNINTVIIFDVFGDLENFLKTNNFIIIYRRKRINYMDFINILSSYDNNFITKYDNFIINTIDSFYLNQLENKIVGLKIYFKNLKININELFLNLLNYVKSCLENLDVETIFSVYNFDLNKYKICEIKSNDMCPITHDKIGVGYRLCCNHEFNKKSIIKWFDLGNTTCPLCREKVC